LVRNTAGQRKNCFRPKPGKRALRVAKLSRACQPSYKEMVTRDHQKKGGPTWSFHYGKASKVSKEGEEARTYPQGKETGCLLLTPGGARNRAHDISGLEEGCRRPGVSSARSLAVGRSTMGGWEKGQKGKKKRKKPGFMVLRTRVEHTRKTLHSNGREGWVGVVEKAKRILA